MAVPEQIPYVGYIGNGTTTIFPITFHLSDPEYLVVTVNKEIPLTGNYTVDATNGNVIFGVAPVSGAQVELYRETQLNRDTEYKSYNNSFRPETVNYDFDKVWQVLQEQHMIDAEVLARIKGEIEWRRTHDANFDELSKMRDSQIFSGLKQYLDTILAGANPNIFDGVTAGIVFALDKKSVQTHLEEIANDFESVRDQIGKIGSASTQAVEAEKQRALLAESNLNTKIDTEKTRALAAESLLEEAIASTAGGYFKSYETLALANADIANIPYGVSVRVLSDIDGGDYYKAGSDATTLTKSPYDPVNQTKNLINASVSKNAELLTSNISIIEKSSVANQSAFSNNFTNIVLISELKNQSINYLSIGTGWRSNFSSVRLRIFTSNSNLDLVNGGRTIANYLSDKVILRDVTYDAENVILGQSRIKYQNIDSTINVEMRIPFETLSSYTNSAMPIGFLLEATKSDGSVGIISCSSCTKSKFNYFYYSENNLNLGLAQVGAGFEFGLQKQGYKESVRQKLSNSSTEVDAVRVPKTDYDNNFFAVAKCFKFLKTVKFNSISLFLSGLSTVDYLRYTIFSVADSAAIDSWMGKSASTPVYSDIVRLDEIKDDVSYYEVEFPFDSSLIFSDQSVGIVVQAMNSDGSAAKFGFRVSAPHLNNLTISEKGYYAGIVSSSQIGLNAFNDAQEISFVAKNYKSVIQTKVATIDDIVSSSDFVGLSTKIENVVKENLAISFDFTYQNMQRKTTTSKTLNFEATATKTDTKNINLLWSGSVSWENRNKMLARYMRNVVVKQGSTTLVENTDYFVYSWYGKINGSQAKNGVDVSVTYTYEPFRVDVVAFNLYTEQLEIVKGTERTQDPYEYMPTLTARYKPVAIALVWGQTVEFFAMGDCFEISGLPLNSFGDFESILSHNRKCLAASIAKLSRSETIKLIGYGDSITATGFGANPTETPNGVTRDRIEYLSEWYTSDTIATIETFTRDNDGTTHAKIGWNWSLIKYIKDFYNVDVNYQNWAIGGTNIFSGRDRLPYVLPTVSFGDLVVLAYGTNDGLDLDALNDVVQGFKSKGANIILMPTPIANPANNHPMSNESEWAKLNQRMINEAMRMGCAIVPTWHYLLEDSPMSIGLSSKFRSNQNLINHPGLYEFQCYGKMLVNAFSG